MCGDDRLRHAAAAALPHINLLLAVKWLYEGLVVPCGARAFDIAIVMDAGVQRGGTGDECAPQVGPELVHPAARAAGGGIQCRGRGAAYTSTRASAAGASRARRYAPQPWVALRGEFVE